VSGGCAGKDMPEQITGIQGARIPWWAAKGQVPGIQGTGSGISNTKEASITANLFSYLQKITKRWRSCITEIISESH
jgi:hypothetical protein